MDPLPVGQFFLLTIPNCLFLQELKKELLHNPTFRDYRQRIQDNPRDHPNCSISHEFILQKGRIWLPKDSRFIPTIITEFHDTPTGGHLGISKTMARIGENFT